MLCEGSMKDYQKAFIDVALESQALCFGEFELKSGRISPYFFNAGLLYSGKALSVLGKSYAAAIVEQGFEFDVVFGPAYKGISLAALTCAALADQYGIQCDFAYNRKEKKDHGEGGVLVGASLRGKKVLVIDDVITAGTAIREVTNLLEQEQAQLTAVVIGLNRQERGKQDLSAIQEIERDYAIRVASIIDLEDIVSYLQQGDNQALLQKVQRYRQRYGVA